MYVEIDGSQTGYRSIGSGDPILLLTRFRGTLDTWDPLFLDLLARKHRVITVDYPGIGYSTGTLPSDIDGVAAFIRAFALTIALDRFAVLGWSWGGLLAQTVALNYPEMVSHAILIGTGPPRAGKVDPNQDWLACALKPVNDLADEEVLFFEPKSEASRRAAKCSHNRIYARPSVVTRIPADQTMFQPFFRMGGEFMADGTGRIERLTRSEIPMLIICGDNDPSFPVAIWYPMIGRIARGQIIVLPQSGHGPQHQYPDLSVGYIDAFLWQPGERGASFETMKEIREETRMQIRSVTIRRSTIVSCKSFDAVVAAVEGGIGKPNLTEFSAKMAAATTYQEMERIVQSSVSELGIMEFMRLDQGAVVSKAGGEKARKMIRLIVGNPLIMQSLARLVPDAGSYAPVTILIDERPDGVHLSYDEMVGFLSPYENADALRIALDLDAKVKSLLERAV
jgi:pimeloyl-ACP methyl ester carboxylesterase